jgi:hypothetical protein
MEPCTIKKDPHVKEGSPQNEQPAYPPISVERLHPRQQQQYRDFDSCANKKVPDMYPPPLFPIASIGNLGIYYSAQNFLSTGNGDFGNGGLLFAAIVNSATTRSQQ